MPLSWKTILALAFSVTALSACQNTMATTDAMAHIVQADEKIFAYFDQDGRYLNRSEAEKATFQRKLYGQTRHHTWVIQDFYQANQQAQTSAFTIFDERGLYDWDTSPFIDGPVEFYFADGSKKSSLHMQKGVLIGAKKVYATDGSLYKQQLFDAQDQIAQEDYFRSDGRLLLRLTADANSDDGFTYLAFDEQGKAHKPSSESKDLFIQAAEYIDRTEAQLQQKEAAF